MRLLVIACVLVIGLGLGPGPARANDTLRMAITPPDGTSYAREMRGFANEVAQESNGALAVRFFMGGIAGDELEVGSRIERGQVDGTASAGMLCQKVMPSFRVMRIIGLFLNRAEVDFTLVRLGPRFAAEAAKAGYIYLGGASMGRIVAFSRVPIRTFAELRKTRLWRWDLDEVALAMGQHMGLAAKPGPIDGAMHTFEDRVVDGFYSIPVAALAFGFHAYTRYLLDMSVDFLSGCMLFSARSFNKLPLDSQQVLRAAAAKLAVRIGEVGQLEDDKLLNGIFAKAGMATVRLPETERSQLLDAARAAREQIDPELVSPYLIRDVMTRLADYRLEHAKGH